jgi:hypothetical protein
MVTFETMTGKPDRRNPALFGPFPRVGPLRMAARLLLGTALTGSDELKRRFAKDQQVCCPTPAERDLLLARETDADLRRYAVLGVVAETATAAQQSLSTAGSLADAPSGGCPVPAPGDQQPLGSASEPAPRPLSPGDAIVHRWVEAGRPKSSSAVSWPARQPSRPSKRR